MSDYIIKHTESSVILENITEFSLSQIFNCGQCFRFNPVGEHTYGGVAFSKYIEVSQHENAVILNHVTIDEFCTLWCDYFDLKTEYAEIIKSFSYDTYLTSASEFSSGLRILRQEPWETLCSFIISQNNNIPRIKGIIETLSKTYGEKVYEKDGKEYFSFPSAKTLAGVGEEAIFRLRTGFRAKYIFDAANKVSSGEIDLTQIFSMNTNDAMQYLQKICGVGPKVASCVLLFAYHKYDAFPMDVWVKKILSAHYPKGTTAEYFGPFAGIAQQCLFYYERCSCGVFLNTKKEVTL